MAWTGKQTNTLKHPPILQPAGSNTLTMPTIRNSIPTQFARFGAILCLLFLLGFVKAAEVDQQDDTFKIFPDSAGRAYFPKGRESFYTRYLRAMGEPSLMVPTKTQDSFTLRFTWLRSFHDPIAIRIWRDGDEYRIRVVRLAKQQDYSPGPITKDQTRSLRKSELSQIQDFLNISKFWQPLNDTESPLMDGCDGAEWIFEQTEKVKYQMVDIWSPMYFEPKTRTRADLEKTRIDLTKVRDFTGYSRLGLYLLKITKVLPAKKEDIY